MTGIAHLALEFVLSAAVLLLGLASAIIMPAGAMFAVLALHVGRYGMSAAALVVMATNAASLLFVSGVLHGLRGAP